MLDHHLQRSIVYQLAFLPSGRFSELKPADIDNKLFTYHLKKVVGEGYVSKSEAGLYSLTPEGRRLSTGVKADYQALIVERPLSVLFLVIRRRSDGAWLFYKRNTHPMLGYAGFMHCQPTAIGDTAQAAQTQCEKKTGLRGIFTPLGGGYLRVFEKDTLESYTHFTLLYCDAVEGELEQLDKQAEYFWVLEPDFTDKELFPSTESLHKAYVEGKPFFLEKTFTI